MSVNFIQNFLGKYRNFKKSSSQNQLIVKGLENSPKFRRRTKRSKSCGIITNGTNRKICSTPNRNKEKTMEINKKMFVAKAEGKTVSIIDGKVFIDYKFICDYPSDDAEFGC